MFDFKEFRKINNLKQSDAAAYLGCAQAFISQIERGLSKVPEDFISKIKADGKYRIPEEKKDQETILTNGDVSMSREVFDKMSQLIDTVCSQQGTIADQQKLITEQHRTIDRLTFPVESVGVRPAEDAGCADVG